METYWSKAEGEYLRILARDRFNKVKATWLDCGKWALPHRISWLAALSEGDRVNRHIVDTTHISALRSYVAGFLEGNTSATRPWFKVAHSDPDLNSFEENKVWLEKLNRRTLITLTNSNFYHAVGGVYYDLGGLNTAGVYIDEMKSGLFFHVLTPGAYYCLNNHMGVADVLIREYALTVKALVDNYGRKVDGVYDWSNFSSRVKNLYEQGNYTELVDIVHIVRPNPKWDPNKPNVLLNKRWISMTYEIANGTARYIESGEYSGTLPGSPDDEKKYLKISASARKPFIVTRSDTTNNFEYGMKGPTSDALGLIKSLNKKAIGKDIALDQMLEPAVQGPSSLKKSYVTVAPRSFVPLDGQSAVSGGLKPILQVNPAIATLNADVNDLRIQVERLYYSDYLLYLTRNPKTRTATETNAVIQEQQLIIGPHLQSLNYTFNNPLVDFVVDYVLDEDPYLGPPPSSLQGEFLRTEFISVFAQAQKAADLPVIDRYIDMVERVGQLRPEIFDKVNLDKLADIYEDRLYLPAGLNRSQNKVDAMREKAAMQAQRQQIISEAVPAMAGAARDLSSTIKG